MLKTPKTTDILQPQGQRAFRLGFGAEGILKKTLSDLFLINIVIKAPGIGLTSAKAIITPLITCGERRVSENKL